MYNFLACSITVSAVDSPEPPRRYPGETSGSQPSAEEGCHDLIWNVTKALMGIDLKIDQCCFVRVDLHPYRLGMKLLVG